tara:strand:+ start:70 stop:573 length:504 start_codon:yes stop_codon:yes gene_type:complete
MRSSWEEKEASWAKKTSLPESISKWAIESISSNHEQIKKLEADCKANQSKEIIDIRLKEIRKNIKSEIAEKENGLDDLSLNTPNSYKLQVSVPSNLNYLMKAWAAAEGRDLSSIALQCLETGLRAMKSKGSIPISAVKRYDIACEKRIALAEANKAWGIHETSISQD